MRSRRDPVYLRIAPEAGCELSACYRNVRGKVDREGGRIQFGWAIWLWPRVLIEAEHHAVHAPADGGPWRDITPAHAPALKRRLFLPDDGVGADAGRRDNVRLPLVDDPLVAQFLAGARERGRIWGSGPTSGPVEGAADLESLELAERLQAEAQVRLAMRYTTPDDPCFCGSRRRFDSCHGRLPR